MVDEIKRRVEFMGVKVKGIVKMTDVTYHAWNDEQLISVHVEQRGGLNVSRETCIKKEDGTYEVFSTVNSKSGNR